MKDKTFTWLKGLSTTGRVLVAAGLLATAGVVNTAANAPKVTTKTVTSTEAILLPVVYQEDENLLLSETKELTPGFEGAKQVTYKITYTGNKETKREKQGEKVTKQATAQLVAKGVKSVETITTTESVPYTTSTKSTSTLTKGTRQTLTAGQNGERTITFQVTKLRGKEVARQQVSSDVTKQPIAEVIALGTKTTVAQASSNCDSNYSGACVPIASDVDCGSGSGNGPAYLYSTATVVGSDIYDLDRDGDGIACE